MSYENIENITKSYSNIAPNFAHYYVLQGINFNGHRLTNNNNSIRKKVINIYFSYSLGQLKRYLNRHFAIAHFLFGSA